LTLEEFYRWRCGHTHNMSEFMPVLRRYAEECRWVTEFGVEHGYSTTAFLAANPACLDSYDVISPAEHVSMLLRLARNDGVTRFIYHVESSLLCATIPMTDLLFVDSLHTYEQVRGELERHGNQARKFLIFHDTIACPEILPAIEEFISANPHWRLREHIDTGCGLTVYERER